MGTKTGKGRRLWQRADHSAESLFLCSAARRLLDFKGSPALTPRSLHVEGFGLSRSLRGGAECLSEFTTSQEMVTCCMRPVSLSSGSLCHFVWKELDLLFLLPSSSTSEQTYTTHPFLPHPPLTRHAIGMKGVAQVEQDGFTSAKCRRLGIKSSTGEAAERHTETRWVAF